MIKLQDIILVNRNARDKIQFANYVLEQEANTFTIKRFTGQYGGKITPQPEIVITAGKAKRNAFQQAEQEFNALIKKTCDKGYKKLSDLTKINWEDITVAELNKVVPSISTDAQGVIKPQLAKSSNDCAASIFEKEFFSSRKIDGTRMLLRYDQEEDCLRSSSRGGGDYDVSTTEIREDEQLLQLFRENPDLILDGELYVHGWPLQRISGTARLKTWEDRCSKLEFWVFDYVDTEKSFNNRLDFLIDLSIDFKDNLKVKILEHELVSGWNKIKKLHDKYVQEGFEGAVLRKPTAVYAPGARNSNWVKIKDFLSQEFKIIGCKEGLRPEDMCFTLITKEGRSFEAKPGGSREIREDCLENIDDYIGKYATIHFFSWTEDLKPSSLFLQLFVH